MLNYLKHTGYRCEAGRITRRLRDALAASLVAVMLAAGSAAATECPTVPAPHIPTAQSLPTPLNIDDVKQALKKYHYTDYHNDLIAVYSVAQSYVESRAGQVTKPAVVLDIDETTLSNWPNLLADDFGFIQNGRCIDLPAGPCGFNAWIFKSRARAIPPALDFFNAVKSKDVALIFITARPASQRQATIRNLNRAGYSGWTKLVLRDDDDKSTAGAYKTAARGKLMAEDKYTIIANIGDQLSDLENGAAECGFKLPNPFYFIP